MHTHCLGAYMIEVEKHNWDGVGDLMLSSAKKLHAAGAQILICPDNTIHQAFDYVAKRSPLPWLHIANVVMDKAKELGLHHLGVLGTKYLMEGPVYATAAVSAGITLSIPSEERRRQISQIIFSELVKGIFKSESIKVFTDTIDYFKEQGCDGVVLGCTEIPLIISAENSSLPPLDSTRLLARAALQWATEQ